MVNQIHTFSFTKTPQIFFGSGEINQLQNLLHKNEKILLITGNKSFESSHISAKLEPVFKNREVSFKRYQVNGEPSPANIDLAVSQFKRNKVECILAIGGGSVMDAGKAIAAMLCEEGSVKEYLEGVGTKNPTGKRLRLITIPTTSGTGSEATKNAVISEFGANGFKKSLRHDNYIPDAAIIDPQLIVECPADITGASGMDAFTQLLESYLSIKSNPLTDAIAYSGLEKVAASLMKAFRYGTDLAARSDMAYAALMSGISLANAGLGLVHGFAQPLGSLFPIPHGIVCGTMMPAVNKATVYKLRNEGGNELHLRKYAQVGKLFSHKENAKNDYCIDLLINTILEYRNTFKIPSLKKFDISEKDFKLIIERTEGKNHPVGFDYKELELILKESL